MPMSCEGLLNMPSLMAGDDEPPTISKVILEEVMNFVSVGMTENQITTLPSQPYASMEFVEKQAELLKREDIATIVDYSLILCNLSKQIQDNHHHKILSLDPDVDTDHTSSGLGSIHHTRVAVNLVYAKCTQVERQFLWADLIDIAVGCSGLWAISGDFSVIESILECLGCPVQNNQAMADFANMIFQCWLKNIPIMGSANAWSRFQQGHPIWKRLDRILVNQQ
ncbi:hypothetical protein ACH5RR_003361 [Cinchona calisaya]|uniref:Uncharacterized protein n=1 Tax=Cinchona calisaya TaxID=153742 RepID=A0ABD3AUN4_9GENT